MLLLVFSLLAMVNVGMGIYSARERDSFGQGIHWFGCGLWVAIIANETLNLFQ